MSSSAFLAELRLLLSTSVALAGLAAGGGVLTGPSRAPIAAEPASSCCWCCSMLSRQFNEGGPASGPAFSSPPDGEASRLKC